MYLFEQQKFTELEAIFNAYLKQLSGKYDNFLEYHILESKMYAIKNEDEVVGIFAIFHEKLLTLFYIDQKEYRYAQHVFERVIKEYGVKSSFVPTCDEQLLTLSLDYHTKVNKQAYFFTVYNGNVREPEFGRECLVLATQDDIPFIEEYASKEFANIPTQIDKGYLYLLKQGVEVLGIGNIEDCHIFKDYKSTGNYVMPNHRQKGVGRSILMNLKEICEEWGYGTIPGCWYYNHQSKLTIQSAGYISPTRLLHIELNVE